MLLKKIIKCCVPYGIIAYRKQKMENHLSEIYLRREQKEEEIRNYFLSLTNVTDPEFYEIIDFFKGHHRLIEWYPYVFTRKYFAIDIDVHFDISTKTQYVMHGNKKLYFPENWTRKYIRDYYNNLCLEQDENSPHRYETDTFVVGEGDIIADVGAAEGIWALSYAEKAKKIYLFECSDIWTNALKNTFAPWKEKTVFVKKYVSDISDRKSVTLDNFFNAHEGKIDFIKADIEGMEIKLLKGAKNILAANDRLKLLLCTYHKENDATKIKEILDNNGFETEYSKRYMICSYDENLREPFLRRGVVRGVKGCKKNTLIQYLNR